MLVVEKKVNYNSTKQGSPMNKSELRTVMRNILVDKTCLITQQNKLLQKLINEISIKSPNCIGLFSPLPNEISLNSIFTKKTMFSYPKICGNILKFYEVKNLRELSPSQPYGIYEPSSEAKLVVPDIIIVPGLAFTIDGTRLGRGKGYYDNYLRQNSCFTVSLAFSWQLLEKIPINSFDVPINLILTTK
jgi:5-formyltetrahydrofolate cyclo-ligase